MGLWGGLLQIGVSVGLQYLMRNSGPDLPDGPRLEDFKIRTSTYGSDITQCYGASRISGNLIWTSGIEEVVVTTKISTGGLFGGGVKQTTFLYFSTFAIGVSEGVSQGPLKIFLDGKLVHDATSTGKFSAEDHEVLWYDGRALQNPSGIIAEAQGETFSDTDVPGFRNLAYAIFNVLPLQTYGNRIPNFTAIIACNRLAAAPQVDVDVAVTARSLSDVLMYDSRAGYVYKFDYLVSGGSGTNITKIDVTDGSVVYSKLLLDASQNPIRLGNGSGLSQNFQQSPIDSMIYATIDGVPPQIAKIHPDLGIVIASISFPSVTSPILALGLWLGSCPSTGGPIECFIMRGNAASWPVVCGMTGNASMTLPIWSTGAAISIEYPFREFDTADRTTSSDATYARQFVVGGGAPNPSIWMLSSTLFSAGVVYLTKFDAVLYLHKTIGVATPCWPAMPGDPALLRVSLITGVDPADSNGRTYDIRNWDSTLPALNNGASQKNGNTLVPAGYDIGDFLAAAGTTTTLNVVGATFLTDRIRPGMSVERTGASPDTEFITAVLSETQLTHNTMSSAWLGTEPFRIRNTFSGGSFTKMAYVGLDNTLIIDNGRGGFSTYAIGKFDLESVYDGGEKMLLVYHNEDYTAIDDANLTGSDFEFPIADSIAFSEGSVGEGTDHTWRNHSGYGINGPLNEPFWGHNVTTARRIDPVTLQLVTIDSEQALSDFTGTLDNTDSMIMLGAGVEGAYFDTNNGLEDGGSLIYFRRAAGNPEDLADVVADLCAKAGLLAHEYDTSGLAGEQVRGYAIGSQAQVKKSLDPLMVAYDFQYSESDWKLKFVKKGGASSVTFLEDDLGVASEKEVVVPTRVSENENVRKITVKYISEERDHQTAAQEAFRILDPLPTSFSDNQDNLDVPILFQSNEAQNIARRILGRVWTERTLLEWSAPPKYLGVDPTDVVTVTADGNTYIGQVQDSGHGGGFQTKITARSDDSAALTNSQGFGAFGDFISPSIPQVFRTQVVIMDGPLVNINDNPGPKSFTLRSQFIYHRGGFPGATAEWGPVGSWQGTGLSDWFGKSLAAKHGFATLALGSAGLGHDGSPGSTQSLDNVNTVEVFMANGETLQSATDEVGFLGCDAVTGGTCCYIGGEIIQAKTAVLQGSGTYLLSGLLRGRFGTESFAFGHKPGDSVVLLQPGVDDSVEVSALGVDQIGSIYAIHSTTTGSSEVEQASTLFVGRSLKPYAPAMLQGERDASDNLTARWVRRDRVPADGVGWGDAQADTLPLNEAGEIYEVALLINGTFDPDAHIDWRESVLRTVTSAPETPAQPLLTFEANFNDLGTTPQNTADITDVAALEDFSVFVPHSWVALGNFDQGDMNSFFVVESAVSATLKLRVAKATGDDTSNTDATVTQLPTYAVFTAAEVAAAGYTTTEPVDVVVYQISATVGRGYPAYCQFGIGG